ncbi:hypothetical protein DICPUDRAFT_57459 [Dictyostelium purpureum]|uniref:Calcium-dependent cell adhesion molecule 1 membrane-binding domain-containing protein n=1 Tax=Dictyostelium purpureum TaxID=5786 RepID=F0ZW35_DICPU|nr:uncharacterized protein DICPUDRAFT_57459 [Dictyostelium purpureum]EGC31853.1 hypothetical protein DICPUDRAFT_57459 [Dictyostelium purpureum]|eukprot:XP_003291623.1 hypothetical protein DICPUDRAFT_57459 [Dictyostelium purpureum]
MSVESNKVKFFTAKNCTGTGVEYTEGDSVAFEPNDQYNDKFLSCIIGTNVWVNAYQHNDVYNPEPGAHEELKSGTHNDLSSLNGLSKFQVLGNEFGYAIDVKLIASGDLVSSPAGTYKFTIIPYQVSAVTCLNGDDYVQCPIPKLNPPNAEIVCQIIVAQTAWPGATVANGSVYFQYDPSTGILNYRKTEGFPTNMDVTQNGKTNFDFKILKETA